MESKLLNNGVFSVRGSGGAFQALWSGVEYAGRGVVLVCFSAAVTSRSRKSPPFLFR